MGSLQASIPDACPGGRAFRDVIARSQRGARLSQDKHIFQQQLQVSPAMRAQQKGQRSLCIWFTGLSGAGKSTLAALLDARLHVAGHHAFVLDGDNVRHGLNKDLGFSDADRVENIRRVAEVAKLMVDAGLVVLVSFISPFRAERDAARALFEPGQFVEVFVNTPLRECERRDVKGLYAKARAGLLPQFTGIDSPYEAPDAPEITVHAETMTPEQGVQHILEAVLPLLRAETKQQAQTGT